MTPQCCEYLFRSRILTTMLTSSFSDFASLDALLAGMQQKEPSSSALLPASEYTAEVAQWQTSFSPMSSSKNNVAMDVSSSRALLAPQPSSLLDASFFERGAMAYDNASASSSSPSVRSWSTTPSLSSPSSYSSSSVCSPMSLISSPSCEAPYGASPSSFGMFSPIPEFSLDAFTLAHKIEGDMFVPASPALGSECGCGREHTWSHGPINLTDDISQRVARRLHTGWFCQMEKDNMPCGEVIYGGRTEVAAHIAHDHGVAVGGEGYVMCPVPGCDNPNALRTCSLPNHISDIHGGQGWAQASECSFCLQILTRNFGGEDGLNGASLDKRHPATKCAANRKVLIRSIAAYQRNPANVKISFPAPARPRTQKLKDLHKEPRVRARTSRGRSGTIKASRNSSGDIFIQEAVPLQDFFAAEEESKPFIERTHHHAPRFNPMGTSQPPLYHDHSY
jgi:hypothetical protein